MNVNQQFRIEITSIVCWSVVSVSRHKLLKEVLRGDKKRMINLGDIASFDLQN